MLFSVVFTHQASKHLERIHRSWRSKILGAIESLKQHPWVGKKLNGKLRGNYSLRVWPYRIIYFINKKEIRVVIIDIAHRQGVYN